MYYQDKISQDILVSNGEIFNIPFNVTWKQDKNKLEKDTNIKFKKIKLNILNSTKFIMIRKKINYKFISIDLDI